MLFYSSHILNKKKNGVGIHKREREKKSKGTAKVLHTCPNQEFFTKMKNIPSALALIHPLVLIFPETLKHLSSALGLPSFTQLWPSHMVGGQGTWQGPSSLCKHKGDGGLLHGAAPAAGVAFTLNTFLLLLPQEKELTFPLQDRFF